MYVRPYSTIDRLMHIQHPLHILIRYWLAFRIVFYHRHHRYGLSYRELSFNAANRHQSSVITVFGPRAIFGHLIQLSIAAYYWIIICKISHSESLALCQIGEPWTRFIIMSALPKWHKFWCICREEWFYDTVFSYGSANMAQPFSVS